MDRIIHSCADVIFRKRLLLLQMVNHGSNLRNWEAECIAPLLAVFCFLLANLLFSLHDIDFRSHDAGQLINFKVFLR